MSRAFYFAHYTAWALIWAHVLFYYAMFAYREWRVMGGLYREVPTYLGRTVRFTFGPLFTDIWSLLRGRGLSPQLRMSYQFTKANRISLFIGMGAVAYTCMGLFFSILPDRSDWSIFRQASVVLLISLTSVTGLGHLFTALESNLRQWRWFVLAIMCWYPIAMALFETVSKG